MSQDLIEFDDAKVELLKQTICLGATTTELELFMHSCKRLGLDPFMRQIHFVKMGGKMTVQTGIDGYRLIAERSGRYMPGKEPTFAYDKDGRLFSATAYIKKLGPDGSWHEIAATAIFNEYCGVGPLWKSKPHIMLAKCAESLVLRRGFPAEMSGVYTEDEMPETIDISQHKAAAKQLEVKTPEMPELIDLKEALVLAEKIGDDIEFRNRIFDGYTRMYAKNSIGLIVKDYADLPKKDYEMILKRVEEHNKMRVDKEMSNKEISDEA